MSVIIFFNASKQLFFCRNDVQAIDFLRKGSYAPVYYVNKMLRLLLNSSILNLSKAKMKSHIAYFYIIEIHFCTQNFWQRSALYLLN